MPILNVYNYYMYVVKASLYVYYYSNMYTLQYVLWLLVSNISDCLNSYGVFSIIFITFMRQVLLGGVAFKNRLLHPAY